LVGQLPDGAYIMLPIPPDGLRDRSRSASGDDTLPSDGWAAFSGTSAAAPQLAGICALMKQVDPSLSPARVKQILQHTARDVVEGFSNPGTGGHRAREGLDLATGSGLADAYEAVEAVKAFTNEKYCVDCASPDRTDQNISTLSLPSKVRKLMYSEFPKLQKKLDELLWKFEQELQAAIDKNEIEEVELRISDTNFMPRSPVTKSAYHLREILDECLDNSGEIKADQIDEEHIAAAQGLLKLGKYQGAAIEVLTQVLRRKLDETTKNNLVSGTSSLKKEAESTQKQLKNLRKLASDALSECGTEIANVDTAQASSYYDDVIINGQNCWQDRGQKTACCPNKKKYTLRGGIWRESGNC
jgi:hypothetical protein